MTFYQSPKDKLLKKCIDSLGAMRSKRNRDKEFEEDCGPNGNLPRELALPQSIVDPTMKNTRTAMIDTNRGAYQLQHDAEFLLPPHCKDVPTWETDDSEAWWKGTQLLDVEKSVAELGLAWVGNAARSVYNKVSGTKPSPFEKFLNYYRVKGMPAIGDHWQRDDEFARQKLQGPLPIYIKKVSKKNPLPKKFPVTDKGIMVNQVKRWPQGMTMEKMIKANRLYWVDYEWVQSILDNDTTKESNNRNMCAPMELLFLDDENEIQPVCVQLGQDPKKYPIVWCGGEDFRDERWRVAKLLCNSSEGSLHEVSNHLLMTHFSMEVVYVNVKRNLAPTHPIHELLQGHFWYTLSVNHAARVKMIATPESAVPKVMCMGFNGMNMLMLKGWKEYTMETYDIEKGFVDREVADAEELPNYWYRDDARKVQGSIRNYVSKVLKDFYKSNKDVVADYELQAFVKELVDPFVCNIRGSPFAKNGKAETLDQVITFCTYVIWACTGYHAALNNGQYDYFGFPLQAPGVLKISPDVVKDGRVFTCEEVADALPGTENFLFQIFFIHALAMPTDQPLGSFAHDPNFMRGNGGKCIKYIKEWNEELNAISKDIRTRNADLNYPYIYLQPEQIASGIAT